MPMSHSHTFPDHCAVRRLFIGARGWVERGRIRTKITDGQEKRGRRLRKKGEKKLKKKKEEKGKKKKEAKEN